MDGKSSEFLRAILLANRPDHPYEQLKQFYGLEQILDSVRRHRLMQSVGVQLLCKEGEEYRFADHLNECIHMIPQVVLTPEDQADLREMAARKIIGMLGGIPIRTNKFVPDGEVWLVSEDPVCVNRFKLPTKESDDADQHHAA